MLDSVRMGTQKVSKAEYKVRFKELVNRLVVLQQEAKKKELVEALENVGEESNPIVLIATLK